MPTMRKMTHDEVRALENKGKGQRKLIEEQYDAILSDYTEGDYGEALLEEEENRLTVRNRLKAAARRRGFSLEFRRTKDDLLRFQIVAGVVEAPPPAPPPAKTRGRKKKAS
jgi:hypothetical protein